MDTELLMALIFLWCSTTMALVIFLSMWFRNRGETFHPHSINVDSRHPMFLVVGGRTRCKPSFVVKSISAFVAPRGSSSNKHFTALIIIMSISGLFGTLRWHAIEEESSFEQTRLAFLGFGALILTAAFETDVSNGRFMEDKLMVTAWLIEKLQVTHLLPFPLHANSLQFRLFLRQAKPLYRYYEEEDRMYVRAGDHTIHHVFPYMPWWSALHTLGAVIYVCAIPTAVMFDEPYPGSGLAAMLTWVAFLVFCGGGYLTGTYLPVVGPLRCIILQWNPFFLSHTFLEELHEAVVDYSNNTNIIHHSNSGELQKIQMIQRDSLMASEVDDDSDHDIDCAGDGDDSGETCLNSMSSCGLGSPIDDRGDKGSDEEGSLVPSSLLVLLSSLSKQQLKDKCRTKGLAVSGSKQQLVARLFAVTGATPSLHEQKQIQKQKEDNLRTQKISPNSNSSLRHRKKSSRTASSSSPSQNRKNSFSTQEVKDKISTILRNNIFLRFAYHHPQKYLHLVGHLMVMFEMVAVLLPSIAIGISWITALCPDNPVNSFMELFQAVVSCFITGNDCDFHSHCILR